MRLTAKRRLPADAKGERVLTPFGEIHREARTLELLQECCDREHSGLDVEKLCGALMYDVAAGFISYGLSEEITQRVKRVQRGKAARLKSKGQA